MNKFKLELLSMFDANIPIIYINSFDTHSTNLVIDEIFANLKIIEPDFRTLFQTLESANNEKNSNSIIVLNDLDFLLEKAEYIYLLKKIAFKKLYISNFDITLFIISEKWNIPLKLSYFVKEIILPLPDLIEIEIIINNFTSFNNYKYFETNILAKNLLGLNRVEILQSLNQNYQINGKFNINDIYSIKEKIIDYAKKSDILELKNFSTTFQQIGGNNYIKEAFSKILKDWKENSEMEKPIKIAISGKRGSGKMILAQAISNSLNIPTIYLNLSNIENSQLLINLLRDIGKFDNFTFLINGNSRKSDFEHILIWLKSFTKRFFFIFISEKQIEKNIFYYFNNIFQTEDLNFLERESVIKIYLEKYLKNRKDIDVYKLMESTKDFNGSEIEKTIIDLASN